MEVNNNSVFAYYKPGHVHPEFLPYLRANRKDQWNNEVNLNLWQRQGSPAMVDDKLVRINRDVTFQKLFIDDACPVGWKSVGKFADNKPSGYCERDTLPFQPIMYTNKSFIAKKQNFDGYTKPNIQHKKVINARSDNQPKLNMTFSELKPLPVSNSFNMRSVNPFTGKYTEYFQSKMHNKTRYTNPNQVDGLMSDWYLPTESGYGNCPTSDSYL